LIPEVASEAALLGFTVETSNCGGCAGGVGGAGADCAKAARKGRKAVPQNALQNAARLRRIASRRENFMGRLS
jgi:hypothetical protein